MRTKKQRGAAMIELALSFTVIFALFAGTFQWGYTFYVYDTLVTQVREAARYASTQPFDATNPSSAGRFKTQIQNIVVYGTPNPDAGAAPNAKGLSASNVTVTLEGDAQRNVTVAITGYTLDSVFGKISLDGRPKATFPYIAVQPL